MYVLDNKEKAYLRKIVLNTKNEYLKREKYKEYEELELAEALENCAFKLDDLDKKIDQIIACGVKASNIENIFTDNRIMKIVKALTLKEKLVLFLYYFECYTDKNIGQELNLKCDTIRKIRVRALEKIRKNYISNGGKKYV